jgi:NAD(P)-dependent dehydrogenase (short-subunit alcohol dehydrogenase family)
MSGAAPLRAAITGASKGIGLHLAREMLAAGYEVWNLSRSAPDPAPEGLATIRCDLADPASVAAAAAAIAPLGLSHLVLNAGLIRPAPVEEADPADMALLAQMHLAAPLVLLQAALPAMKARGLGRVIFNGSRAALGVPTRTAYSATKAGLVGMARTWALELAPHGVTVNVVSPGPIRTDNFWEVIPEGSDREADLARRLPVGRLGETGDVVRAMMFFAAPEASFVTGQTLHVCGGGSVGALSL